MTLLKMGFIGCGNVVRGMHLPALALLGDQFEVVAFCDIDQVKATDLAAPRKAGAFATVEKMLDAHPDLDLVTVATRPPSAHIPVAVEALERGVNVYVEKPFAANIEEARRGFEVAARVGKTLCAYQNRRFEVAFMAFQEALDSGVVGKPGIILRHTNCGIEPDDFLDFGAHIFDQVVCFVGPRRIVEVSGAVQHPAMEFDEGSFGWYHAEARCEDGLVVIAEKLPYPEQRSYFYAAGDKGMFHHDWCDSRNDLLRKMTKRMGNSVEPAWCATFLDKHCPGFHEGPDATFYYLCYESMYDHLVKGAPAPVPPLDTLRAYALMQAMMRSAIAGETVPFEEPVL